MLRIKKCTIFSIWIISNNRSSGFQHMVWISENSKLPDWNYQHVPNRLILHMSNQKCNIFNIWIIRSDRCRTWCEFLWTEKCKVWLISTSRKTTFSLFEFKLLQLTSPCFSSLQFTLVYFSSLAYFSLLKLSQITLGYFSRVWKLNFS